MDKKIINTVKGLMKKTRYYYYNKEKRFFIFFIGQHTVKIKIDDEIILNDDSHITTDDFEQFNEATYCHYLGKISGLMKIKNADYILIDNEKQILSDGVMLVINYLRNTCEPFSLTFIEDKDIPMLFNLLEGEISVWKNENTYLFTTGEISLFLKQTEEEFPNIDFLFQPYSTELDVNANSLLSVLNEFLIFNDKKPIVSLIIENDVLKVKYQNHIKDVNVKIIKGEHNTITLALKYIKDALSYCKNEITLKIRKDDRHILYIHTQNKDIFIAGIKDTHIHT